jgi:mannose/fructose/N-acetylgalactosamine-specific phosphotransferase system component IIC
VKKTQTIKFSEFMSGEYKKPKQKQVKAYSVIYINPWAFIDPTICTIGGVVLGIALFEKFLERKEYFSLLEKMQSVTGLLFPAIGFGSLVYMLISNPILGWL